ncbi:MAG: hypothetical protein JSU69_00995 [Candidatus Zixiibacteriota bacterium]|nr:MAG: hypothetical protein JSU69_00995 [candidate division Zixibacteria bacterium]
MPFSILCRRSIRFAALILTFLPALVDSGPAFVPRLEPRIYDETARPGQQDFPISVYLTNYFDSVAGFDFLLVISHPELLEFQTRLDTAFNTTYWKCTLWSGELCIDSADVTDSVIADPSFEYDRAVVDSSEYLAGIFDTTGTLCSGWEFISARPVSGYPHFLMVTGRADTTWPPYYTPGIGCPQFGDYPLIKLLADVNDISDTVQDRTVIIWWVHEPWCQQSVFYDETGDLIGCCDSNGFNIEIDTSWFVCDVWVPLVGETCYFYTEVAEGPIDSVDSFWCCDTLLYSCQSDTSVIRFRHGSVTVLYSGSGICGDSNNDFHVNLIDVTYVIDYLYRNGPSPPKPDQADTDCDGSISLLDATYLINYLYRGGPQPGCFE